jgi:hypothetical protein
MAEATPPSNYDAFNSSSAEADGESDVYGKDKKASLDKMRGRIKDAQSLRKTAEWDTRWSKFISVYSNRYPYPELEDYEDVVVPNMVFSTVNVIVPSIAINVPKIDVTANAERDAATAEVVASVVNHQWNVYNVQEQVRQAVKDFVIIGHGWLKVVWETEEADVKLTADEFTAAVAEALQSKQAAVAQSPDMEDMFPDDDQIIDSIPSKRTKLVKDQPLVRRVSPFDMFIDPDALVLEDARWIAQRSFVPIEVARRNEDWNAEVRARISKVKKSKTRDEVDVEDDSQKSDSAGFAEVYEFYDLVNGKMCVFCEGTEGFLLDPDDSPFPDGHPFVFVPNYEVPERFFPIGDVETIYPLQVELALTRTAQLNDRKRGRRITLFKEANLDAAGVEALRAGEDNVMINVTSTSASFDEVFKQVSSQGLQPEWYRADQQAMSDIDLVSGVTEYQRGGQTDIRRTATEVGVMQDAANSRQADKLGKVESAMAQVAERMIKLSQEFMDTEAVARVVDDFQAVSWVPYNRDALQGDFTFKVEAGSTQPQNESFKRQQALQMMDVLGGFMGSGLLNDQEVLAQVMRLNGWHDVEKYLGPGLPPPVPETPDGSGQMPVPEGGMPPQMMM